MFTNFYEFHTNACLHDAESPIRRLPWILFTMNSHDIHNMLIISKLWEKNLTSTVCSNSLKAFFDRKVRNGARRLRRLLDRTGISLVRQANGRILLENSAPSLPFPRKVAEAKSHPPRFAGSCLRSSRIAGGGRKLPWDRNFRSQWQGGRSRFPCLCGCLEAWSLPWLSSKWVNLLLQVVRNVWNALRFISAGCFGWSMRCKVRRSLLVASYSAMTLPLNDLRGMRRYPYWVVDRGRLVGWVNLFKVAVAPDGNRRVAE